MGRERVESALDEPLEAPGRAASWERNPPVGVPSRLGPASRNRHSDPSLRRPFGGPYASRVAVADPASLVVAVDTGDRIHYLDWGGPAPAPLPALVLIHGLSQTAWAWTPVARRLSAATRVLAVDLRGHGLSEAPPGGYDLESLAYDALTVMVANGIGLEAGGQPAVVAGHGFGAMVGAAMARLRPSAIAGVALVDGGWEEVAESSGQTPAEFLSGLAEPPEVMRSMESYLADRRDYDPGTWDADQERAARAAVDEKYAGHVVPVTRPHVLRRCVEAMFEYRADEALSAVAAPLLVLVAESGTADDEVALERRLALDDALRAREDAGHRPARVARYGGVGHNLMRYRPDEVSAELLALLRSAGPR